MSISDPEHCEVSVSISWVPQAPLMSLRVTGERSFDHRMSAEFVGFGEVKKVLVSNLSWWRVGLGRAIMGNSHVK